MAYETASYDDFDQPSKADQSNAFEELQRSFEAFKQANDARLDVLEKGGSPDTLDLDKIERIERDLNRLSAIVQRPSYQSTSEQDGAHAEVKAAFTDYVRGGDTSSLQQLERRDLSSLQNAEGGYLVPDEIELGVSMALKSRSPIRRLASVQTITSGNTLNVLKPKSAFSAAWVGETEARPKTANTELEQFTISIGELYAQPICSANFLEDSGVDVEQWIRDSLVETFSIVEDAAFFDGNGSNKPHGIAQVAKSKSPSDPKKTVAMDVTGHASALPANKSDFLLNVAYGLASRYRSNASWLMNASTINALRKEKNSDGDYIWQPAQAEGNMPILLGFPVHETANLSDVGTNTLPIIFGDIRAAYLIVDRKGLSILRDPFSFKPHIGFYATKRVGGRVVTPEAMRIVKVAAS